MGSFSHRYVLHTLSLFIWLIQAQSRPGMHLIPWQTSFSFPNFNSIHMTSPVVLTGDAQLLSEDGSAVRISGSSPRSSGRLIFAKPVRFLQPLKSQKSSVSFTSYFSFSMSPGKGDGMAFVILPGGYPSGRLDGNWFGLSPDNKGSVSHIPKLFAVEFDCAQNNEVMDLNSNHVGIDLQSLISIKSVDVSEIELMLNDGTQLHAWIDYDSRSKSLEVRLSKSGISRPCDPLISHSVDLSEVWEDEMYVGFSSSNGDSFQTNFIYSWNFSSAPFHWPEHSHPVNPKAFFSHDGPRRSSLHWKANDVLGFLITMLFGTGCGAMAALVMFFVWSLFTRRVGFTSTEFVAHPVNFGYQKIATAGGKESPSDNVK